MADAYANDPGHLGVSLVAHQELLLGCLDAVRASSVVEVGAYAGDLTGLLLDWAGGATVTAIDPTPQPELEALERIRPELTLVRKPSLQALAELPVPDVVVIDGDHNHFTVLGELEAVERAAGDSPLPLLLFHDVAWPHARRDDYAAPGDIPPEHRQPVAPGGGLSPGEPGTDPNGLPYHHPAAREGGARNGVLTAVEDFVAGRDDLRFVVVPAFFGFGAIWPLSHPAADALGQLLAPYHDNPLLERLEDNRVLHLVRSRRAAAVAGELGAREAELDVALERLRGSRTLALAERISRLAKRGRPEFSAAEVTETLDRR